MFLNHEGVDVYQWDATAVDSRPESLCPECSRPLIAKRGDLVTWHWAHHKQDPDHRCEYGAGETDWHLRWKAAFAAHGWRVEYRYTVGHLNYSGKLFRYDACRLDDGGRITEIVEFVHSASDDYIEKQYAATADDLPIVWVFDGTAFVSAGAGLLMSKCTNGPLQGLYQRFLKPKCFDIVRKLEGIEDTSRRILVVYLGMLWKHEGHNIWRPLPSSANSELFRGWDEGIAADLLRGEQFGDLRKNLQARRLAG